MIKRVINVDDCWKVIAYSNISYNLFSVIITELNKIGVSKNKIISIYNNMFNNGAKAVTISSLNKKESIVLFNKHKSNIDFINSIIHESEHIKQSILAAYNIDDIGEPPAYIVGYIATQLLLKLL